MNMFDEARSIATMMKMRKFTQNEVAKMLGVSQSYIGNKLRLLKLDKSMQDTITKLGLTERHARALVSLESNEERWVALKKICNQGLSVSQTEALVDLLRQRELPSKIGRSNKLKATDFFIDNIKNSTSALSSLGLFATNKITYSKEKIWITICVSND